MTINQRISKLYYSHTTKELYTIQADNENKLLVLTILTPDFMEESVVEYENLSFPVKIGDVILHDLELVKDNNNNNIAILSGSNLKMVLPDGQVKTLIEIQEKTYNKLVSEIME